MSSFVSVILCTLNRERLLRRALDCLGRQTMSLEGFEIIVVDDGSTDDTTEICTGVRARLPNLKVVSAAEHVGFSRAGNMGISEAKGDLVLFTDDDCLVQEDWIERMAAALDRAPIVAGTIASPTQNGMKLCQNIDEFHAFLPGKRAGPRDFIAGANMGFRRGVLEELNGFDDKDHMCRDMELMLRARQKGYRAHYAPEVVVTHDPDRDRLADVLRHAVFRASETIQLRNQYRSLLKTPFVLRSPSLLLLCAPVIALRVTAGIYAGNRRLWRHLWTLPVVYLLKLGWCWGAARSLRARAVEKRKR